MKRYKSFSAPAVLILLAFLVSISAQAQPQSTNAVEIKNSAFNPSTLTVPVGTTVTWTNDDSFDHTVTSNSGAFNSGDISGGSKFSHNFNQPGNYPYHCSIHTFMHGMIQVTSAAASSAVKSASTKYNVTIANALKEGTALHVLVANNGTTATDLTSWKLTTDNNNSTFIFPAFVLKPKAVVTIHTHMGNNTAADLYGSNFMWNGTHEIKLLEKNGTMVYDYRIGIAQPTMK